MQHTARRRVWPFGLVAAIFGAVATLVALHVSVPHWLRPSGDPHGTGVRLHGALVAVLLLVLARGLLVRRRVAYVAGVVVAICGALSLGPGFPALFLVIVAVLPAARPADFPALPARVRTALVAGLVLLAAGGVYDITLRWQRLDPLSLLLLTSSVILVVLLASGPAPPPADEHTRDRVRALAAHPGAVRRRGGRRRSGGGAGFLRRRGHRRASRSTSPRSGPCSTPATGAAPWSGWATGRCT